MQAYQTQAQMFKVLMHPARLAILDVLRDGEECVCHIEAALGFRQAYISQQLMLLRDAGLVEDRRDGWNIYYRTSNPEIYRVVDAMNELTGQAPGFESKPEAGDGKKTCPCPKCNPTAEAVKC